MAEAADPQRRAAAVHTMADGTAIAWLADGPRAAERTGTVWLGGFRSDMRGTKAEALAASARSSGRPALRFDYSGHGESGGDFAAGTIGRWLDEADAVVAAHGPGRLVLVGSSMGGWIALLLARRLMAAGGGDRLAGLVLIAPAADMTEDLMWNAYDESFRQAIVEHGSCERPSQYSDEPYVITRALIEDGRNHLLLETGLTLACPVRILHGDADPDVPWQHGLKLYRALSGPDVTLTLIKGGDHRLSSPRDLALITDTVELLCAQADAASAASPSR